jgi:NAD-dependent deacetylase
MLVTDALPNPLHNKLSQWEAEGKLSAIVTQNIDGLHQKAGSKKVYELHGSVLRNYCTRCGKFHSAEFIKESEGVPKCACGGTVKPDVVLYEEGLDHDTIEKSVMAIHRADLLIVAGTSLTVYPAAGLINYYQGNRLVLINRDATPYDSQADLVFHESLGSIFSQL